MKKKFSRIFLTAVIYRWLWFLLLSRVEFTRKGLTKIWAFFVNLLQSYLASFGANTFDKVAHIAGSVWGFLLVPALGIILLYLFFRGLKKYVEKRKANPKPMREKGSVFKKIFDSPRQPKSILAPLTPPETYYLVRYTFPNEEGVLCEQLVEATALRDKEKTFRFRCANFTLSFSGEYDCKIPLIYLTATGSDGQPILEDKTVLLPFNSTYNLPLNCSFELMSSSI